MIAKLCDFIRRCCSKIPPSTKTDYFFDPRIMTIGPPLFNPDKTQNIVSEPEFEEIRKEMFNVGGTSLKVARFFYFGMTIYSTLVIVWWSIFIGLQADGDDKLSKVAIILAIIFSLVPLVVMRYFLWVFFMRKASENIQKMFDRQNIHAYNARGVKWGTHKTLLYIHIRILDPQLRPAGNMLTADQPLYNHQLRESYTPGAPGPMEIYAAPPIEHIQQIEQLEYQIPLPQISQEIKTIQYQVPVQINFQYELPQQQFAEYQNQYHYPLQVIPEREEYQDHQNKVEEEEESQSIKMELPSLDECQNLSREYDGE